MNRVSHHSFDFSGEGRRVERRSTEPQLPTHKPLGEASAESRPPSAKYRRNRGPKRPGVVAKASSNALANRPLSLTHTAPAHDAPDLLVQETTRHLSFLTGLKLQELGLAGVSVSALFSTAGLVSNVAGGTPFGPPFSALALLLGQLGHAGSNRSAASAKDLYLASHTLLADNQRVLADIEQRARKGGARPEDAALRQVTEVVVQALQEQLADYESGYFNDPQSPHAQAARAELEQRARAQVALSRDFKQCGEHILELQARLAGLGLNDAQRTGIQNGIAALERRRTQLKAEVKLGRQSMKKVFSPGHLRKLARQQLKVAREALEQAQHEAFVRSLPYGPDKGTERDLRIQVLQGQRRRLVQRLLNGSLPEPGIPIELLERWDAEALPAAAAEQLAAELAEVRTEELDRLDDEIALAVQGQQVQLANDRTLETFHERVLAWEKEVRHLSLRPDRLLMHYWSNLGSARRARFANEPVDLVKAAFDATITGNAANTALGLAPVLFSNIPLLGPVGVLNMFAGLLDMQRGSDGRAAAAAAKVPVVQHACATASLLSTYRDDPRPEVQSLAYAVQSALTAASRQLTLLHSNSRINHGRGVHGAYAVLVGGLLTITSLITVFTGVPVVLFPAVAGGTEGASYAGWFAKYLADLSAAEKKAKQERLVAEAFVRRFGVQGIAQLQAAARSPHTLGEWTERLDSFRRELRATKRGRGIDSKQLQLHALLDNGPLNAERLLAALRADARDHRRSAEADLVSSLAQAQGLPDPGTWPLAGFPSEAAHEKAVRAALHRLLGVMPAKREHRLLKDPRKLVHVARRVHEETERAFTVAEVLSDVEPLSHWAAAVAKDPGNFGAHLAALHPAVRENLRNMMDGLGETLREQGIGPRELLALQAACVAPAKPGKDHPLKAFPALLNPAGPFLLQLLADPSLLAEATAATQDAVPTPVRAQDPAQDPAQNPTQGPAQDPAQDPARRAAPTDADLVAKLTKAHKAAGRDRRAGPRVHAPRLAPPASEAAQARARREGWPQRAAHHVRAGLQGSRNQLYNLTPNKMATPAKTAKALKALEQAKDGAQLQRMLQDILLSFAREVGGPDLVLDKDETLMAQLTAAQASATEVKQAHLQALLRRAGDTAARSKDSIDQMLEQRPHQDSHLRHLRDRMKDTKSLCELLDKHLSADRGWGASLQPIQVH